MYILCARLRSVMTTLKVLSIEKGTCQTTPHSTRGGNSSLIYRGLVHRVNEKVCCSLGRRWKRPREASPKAKVLMLGREVSHLLAQAQSMFAGRNQGAKAQGTPGPQGSSCSLKSYIPPSYPRVNQPFLCYHMLSQGQPHFITPQQ